MFSRDSEFRAELFRPSFFVWVAALLIFPWVATDFFTFQIGAYSLLLGLIALSLMMLGGYGGMVSRSRAH